MISLSLIEWLRINNVEPLIKWPNDIYVGDKKIAGILIENSFSSPSLEVSIIGVGLNLNQIEFSKDLPNPTSMFLLTGNQYRPEIVITEIMVSIQMRYMQLMYGLKDLVSNDYLKSLYKYQQLSDYATIEGKFKAKIVGVKPTGELILETEQGQIKSFGFKEVSFEI
jgi:BirA family biotin operon repressor/biotin-[acetyl-CoA-carboxylase] ligase